MEDKSSNQIIIQALLEAKDTYVSGEALANTLGLSRVAVWKRLEILSEAGFRFEAIRNRGYRLLEEPTSLHPDLIQVYFNQEGINKPVYFLDSIDSTNTEGMRRLGNGAVAPGLVIARTMSAGRGRLGRSWMAMDTGNLYFSFIFRPNQPLEQLSRLSLWVGLKVCEALRANWDIPVQLKWPNDLLFQGKKLAGMLAESTIDTDHVRHLVFGIGLNVNPNTDHWLTDLANKATSLALAKGQALPLHHVAAVLAKTVFEAYDTYMEGRYMADFETLWTRFDALENQPVKVRRGETLIEGVAAGLDPTGALKITTADGNKIAVHAGDVTLSGTP